MFLVKAKTQSDMRSKNYKLLVSFNDLNFSKHFTSMCFYNVH